MIFVKTEIIDYEKMLIVLTNAVVISPIDKIFELFTLLLNGSGVVMFSSMGKY